ncbi:TPA: allophanate hydrolase, partial [Pseudomonas aeruginosa]|nr:allophanate hydrolase [Pseudomonas aeruginosa]
HYHLGIPPSGALDQYALRAANLLVGNAPTAAVLECALLGPQLEFQRDALVAVCGARMTPRLEGAEMPLDTSFRVRAGQVLGFDFIRAGARGYLAIDGGIAVPEVLGSRSTYGLGAIGGLQGRRLAEGDLLPLGPASPSAVEGLALPRSLQVEVGGEVSLRVVPGLYVHRLTPDAVERFFAETWTVG